MPDFRVVLSLLLLSMLAASPSAYVTTMHIPAVLVNQNVGSLTVVRLNVTPGSGSVLVDGPANVSADTLVSAQTAASYAASFLGLNEKSYTFNYTIEDVGANVSGPSAGLAFTLLAVAALQHRQLALGFTATGTIASDGSVGLIGGITDKSQAAAAGGMRFILAPYAPSSSFEYLLYYISQQDNGIPVVTVTNVSQALPYAFGNKQPSELAINLTQGYNINAAGASNITCTECNISAFDQLINFTLNYTANTVSSLGSNFSAAANQLDSNLANYDTLASHGYLYTAADFAFLNFITAFTLANSHNYTSNGAADLLSGISSYCSSVSPPPLTDQNYEFVIGGKLRQYWANYTLNTAQQQLNGEQSTDGLIQSIYTAASALGWCEASSQLYTAASEMGGNYVQESPSLASAASMAINKARSAGNGMYLQAAQQAYGNGDYAVALYSATYATTFDLPVPNLSTSQLYSRTLANIANSSVGTWPSQFASQSEFYFRQSLATSGANETGDAAEAYSTSLLAAGIAADNKVISSSFVFSNQTGAGIAQAVSGIEQNVSQIYSLLLINAALLLAVLVVLLFHILQHAPKSRARRRQ